MSTLLSLLIQIVVIVAAARAAGVIFTALRQPRVIGEMVAGVLLGPTLLGRAAPEVSAWLFPAGGLDLLGVFSQLGIVLFMLLVGLRLDEGHVRIHARAVAITSCLNVAVPFALGAAFAYSISSRTGISAAKTAPFVGFVGLSLSITAFPVLVRILSEHRLADSRLGTVATACAASGDIAGWIALAFLTSVETTGGASIGASVMGLALYGAVMTVAVRPLLRWVLKRASVEEGMAFVVIAALASAAATEGLGIHALFGSFFVGVLLSKDIKDRAVYTQRIEPLTTLLLLPLFFAFTGLRTDLLVLSSADLLVDTAFVLTLAVAGKAAGPLLMSRQLGFSGKETLGLVALVNTRGLVELVVLNIGLDAGLLPPGVFAMLLMMALITTTMTSPLLSWLGYRRGLAAEAAPAELTGRGPTGLPFIG